MPNNIPPDPIDRVCREARQKQGDSIRIRRDLLSLCSALTGDIDTVDPIALFWNMIHPQLMTLSGTADIEISEAPNLSEETEAGVLACLEHLEKRHKVHYVPDESESELKDYFNKLRNLTPNLPSEWLPVPNKLMQLVVYLHVVAARALRLKAVQGNSLSEEVLNCLNEAEGTIDRLERIGMNEASIYRALFQISSLAVSARVFVELGKSHRGEGNMSEALRYFARAGDFQDHVYSALELGLIENHWGSDSRRDPSLGSPVDLKSIWIEKGVGDLSPQNVASTFLSLKKSGDVEDWSLIWRHCQRLSECEVMFRQYHPEVDEYVLQQDVNEAGYPDLNSGGVTALVQDDEGRELTWGQFWYAAEAWIGAQLSPNAFVRQRDEYNRTESEKRLTAYFFGEDWNILPERAQRRLINADHLWCLKETGAIETILNEILRAMELACDKFIWEPLPDEVGESYLRDTLKPNQNLHIANRTLNAKGYIGFCESTHFRDFLVSQNFPQHNIQFLTKVLPEALDELRIDRNRAEHVSESTWYRADVEEHFRAFVGIGRLGVLPELVRIGRRLRSRQPQ